MRKISILVTLLVVGAVGFSIAAPQKGKGNGRAPAPPNSEMASCTSTVPASDSSVESDALSQVEWTEPFMAPVQAGNPPACPALRSCPNSGSGRCRNNESCYPVGNYTRVDTGLTSCTQTNGQILQCPSGQTIKKVVGDCGHCPCCSTNPACVCPIDCGQEVRKWGCTV